MLAAVLFWREAFRRGCGLGDEIGRRPGPPRRPTVTHEGATATSARFCCAHLEKQSGFYQGFCGPSWSRTAHRGVISAVVVPVEVVRDPGVCGLLLTPDELQVLAGEHAARERPLGQMFQGFVADQVGEAGVG